jgi:hypothetical protein
MAIQRVCVCVSSLSTFEPMDRFSRNLVRMLCHYRPPQCHTFYIPGARNNSMTDTRTCEVGAHKRHLMWSSEVMLQPLLRHIPSNVR